MIVAPVAADNRIDSGDDPRASHSSPAARAPSRTSTMWLKPDSATWERRSATHHHPLAPLPLSVPPLLPKRSTPKSTTPRSTGHRATLGVDSKNRCHTALPGRGRRPIKSVIFRFCDGALFVHHHTPPRSPQKHPPRRRCWVLVEHFRISQAKGTSAEQRYVPFLS